MKTRSTAILAIVAVALLAIPGRSNAQIVKGDTMFVNPNPVGNLSEVILGDTTQTGQRADSNRVYVLFGGTNQDTSIYYYDNQINMYNNITIIGRPDPTTGMLPIIAPIYNIDGNIPPSFVNEFGTKTKVVFRNLFFIGKTPDGRMQTIQFTGLDADSIRCSLDHVIISSFMHSALHLIQMNANYIKLFVTNCEFRNIQTPQMNGAAVAWYNAKAPSDSCVFVNNTLFCTERSIVGAVGYCGTLILNHNTIFCTADPPLDAPEAYHEVITNNIWYSDFAGGLDSAYMKAGNIYNVKNRVPADICLDSLRLLAAPPFNFTEADRRDTIMNNAYCWDPALVALWKAISDTATHDPGLVTRPVWMDSMTTRMFTDKSAWPLMYMANNDSTNPDFNPTLVKSTIDSLVKWVSLWWTQKSTGTFLYGQDTLNPASIFSEIPTDWASKQNYPVPENLTYSNASMTSAGTDGFALGDLNWFPAQMKLWEEGKLNAIQTTGEQVPTRFNLSQNYPNPFNPSTDIKVSLKQSGVMSLEVYNVLGQLVDVIAEGYRPAGEYTFNVNMDRFASGVYFYTLREGSSVMTKKMLLLK